MASTRTPHRGGTTKSTPELPERDDLSTWRGRLAWAKRHYGLNGADMTRDLPIAKGLVNDWLRGATSGIDKASLDNVLLVCERKVPGVRAAWILTGDGTPLGTTRRYPRSLLDAMDQRGEVSPTLIGALHGFLFERFLDLPKETWGKIVDIFVDAERRANDLIASSKSPSKSDGLAARTDPRKRG